jgi:O-antigen/teichoic acid export membrane protein
MARSHRGHAGHLPNVSIRALSADFAFYGLLDLLQRSITIIMVPIYTRVLSQREFGDLDIILVLSSFLFILVDLQFTAGFSRLYYESAEEGTDRRLAGTAVTARLISGVIAASVFLVLGFYGRLEWNFLPSFEANRTAWILAVAVIPLTLCYDILLLHARMLRWKRSFAVGSLSNVFVSCVLTAYLAVVLHLGVVSVLLGMFIGKVVGLSLLAWELRQKVTLCIDAALFKRLIVYTWPLIPAVWVSHSSVYGNRFFVFGQLGAEENAILSLSMKFVSILGMFALAFHSAWQPIAMSHIGKAEGDAFYVRSTRLLIAGSLFSMFFVTALLDPVLPILAPASYSSVQYYFPMFAVGMVLSTCSNNIQLGHQIAKTTLWISVNAMIAVGINIGLLAVLLKPYGIFGAGVAWLVSFSVGFLVMYYSAQRKHRIPYDTRAFAILAAGCVLLLVTGFVAYEQVAPRWVNSSLALVLGILLPWLVVRNTELEALKAVVKREYIAVPRVRP